MNARTEPFTITFHGPALYEGRMPVRELAPALLALADVFSEVAKVETPERPDVNLTVTAHERGSFAVQLAIEFDRLWDQVVDIFSGDTATALANLKSIVIGGSIAGAGGTYGVLGLRSLLRRLGPPAEVEETSETHVLLKFPGVAVEVRRAVHRAVSSPKVRRAADVVLAPLDQEGVDRIEISDGAYTEVIEAGRDDLNGLEDEQSGLLGETEFDAVLQIVSMSFKRDNKWRVTDGLAEFWVGIEDEAFLDRIENGEAFSIGDQLRCRLRRVQSQTAAGALVVEHTIVTVWKHTRPGEQLRLDR